MLSVYVCLTFCCIAPVFQINIVSLSVVVTLLSDVWIFYCRQMTSEVPEKSWELSHYEINRKAQALISKKVTIAVSSKVCWTLFYEDYLQHHLYHQSVHSELRCPICLDLLTATMTTKECLHRFCAECIITALRSGRKKGL